MPVTMKITASKDRFSQKCCLVFICPRPSVAKLLSQVYLDQVLVETSPPFDNLSNSVSDGRPPQKLK